MTRDEVEFIIETLEVAIDWSSYADDYFKEKHNLYKDKEDVKKSIEILRNIKPKATMMQGVAIMMANAKEYDGVNLSAFNEWMAYKKYKNKGAITKTLNMLNKYDFQTQQEMVDKSIMNEYKGLFEPKKQRNRTDNNVDVAQSWLEENDFLEPKFISGDC